MPTYQYQCTECGEPLEIQQTFTDEALTVCPSCGGRLRKMFNAVGVVFKGSGFYVNDSRPSTATDTAAKKSDTAAPKADKPAASTSSDSSRTPKAAPVKKSGSDSAA